MIFRIHCTTAKMAATVEHFAALASVLLLRGVCGTAFINLPQSVSVQGSRAKYEEKLCRPSEREFSYNPSSSAGPSQWWRISPCCGGRLQSPIPLSRHTARCMAASTPRYTPTNITMTGTLHNSGHHVMLTFDKEVTRPRLCNVMSKDDVKEYVLDHVHVHFGSPHSRGSEHIIDGEQFQGEIHMVHYREEYGSVTQAMQHKDGLTVCAIPLSLARGDRNTQLHNMLQALNSLEDIEQTVTFTITPDALLPGRRDVFYYHGSLTTPPCSETVQFFVLDQPLHITPEELRMLWKLPSSEKQVPISRYSNVRPLVAVNDRPVLTNFVCWCCLFN